MDKNYLEILSKNILNDIKNKLINNNVVLEKNQELSTDMKMLKIIESVVQNDYEFIYKDKDAFEKDIENKELNSYVMSSLIQYYMAIYHENLDLLHKLLDNKFNWESDTEYKMNLFVLDKRLTSNFSENELFDILEGNTLLLRNFYRSLYRYKDDKEIDEEKFIKMICNILKRNKDIGKSKWPRCNHLFTVDLLMNFSEDEILNLTDTQKHILDGFENDKNKGTELKLNLIKNYNYSKNLIYWEQFDTYFTIDEILNFTDSDIELFSKIFNSEFDELEDYDIIVPLAIQKIKNIKKINPNFDYKLYAIVYDVLSEEEIMSLSIDGVNNINHCCFQYRYSKFESEYNLTEKNLRRWIKNKKRDDSLKNKILKLHRTKKTKNQF